MVVEIHPWREDLVDRESWIVLILRLVGVVEAHWQHFRHRAPCHHGSNDQQRLEIQSRQPQRMLVSQEDRWKMTKMTKW